MTEYNVRWQLENDIPIWRRGVNERGPAGTSQGHSRNKEDECYDGVMAVNVQGEVLGHPCHIRIPGGHTMNIGNKESQT
jgi:hypothetical protein